MKIIEECECTLDLATGLANVEYGSCSKCHKQWSEWNSWNECKEECNSPGQYRNRSCIGSFKISCFIFSFVNLG
jgi:hypothetical protein